MAATFMTAVLLWCGAAVAKEESDAKPVAFKPEDCVGFWEGWVEGRAFPNPRNKVVVELWMQDGKLVGMQGTILGVSKLDGIQLRGNKMNCVFYVPEVGPAILAGELTQDKVYRFRWQVGDEQGTGEVHWVNPWDIKPITDEQVSGTYNGVAWGPMVIESFAAQLELKVTGEKISGRVISPDGIFYITEGVYRQNRLRFVCVSEDDMKVLVIGTAGDMGVDIFWTVGHAAGRAALFKSFVVPAGLE